LPHAQSHSLPQSAPHAVAGHAAAQRLGDCKTDLGPGLPLDPQTNRREIRPRDPKALIVSALELGALEKPGLLRKGKVLAGALDGVTWRSEQLSPSLRSASSGLWLSGALERPGHPSSSFSL
jgi:hypothetical protein